MITIADVEAARARTGAYVRRTPVLQAQPGGNLWFKCEFLLFKTRGAFNRQLTARERGELDPAAGIVTASGGNAGMAHAYVAATLGVPATVFVPSVAPQVKIDRLRSYGADVRSVGSEYAQAFEAAREHSAATGALLCHAYDQPEVVAGAGVMALEILDDLAQADTIVVAAGGAGLFGGVAVAAHARGVRVVAVEPERAPTLHAALAAGEPVDVSVSGVAMDSLGGSVGSLGFEVARRTDPVSVLVDDDAIVAARDILWDDYRIPAETGAATAYAALTTGAYRPASDETVVVIVCGANTDVTTLGAAARPAG